VTAHITKL